MTHDEERLERYLEWRRAEERDRAARRRRVIGSVVVPALCGFAVGLAGWMVLTSGGPSTTAAVTEPAPVVELPERLTPALPRPEPPARTRTRSRPRSNGTAPRAPIAAQPPAPAERDSDSPDLSASVATAEPPRETPSPAIETPSTPAAPPPAEVAAPPAQAREDVASDPPPPATARSAAAVAVAPPTVRERVSDWAQGEVQEFRQGLKREVNEFRAGYEKVRGFFKR